MSNGPLSANRVARRGFAAALAAAVALSACSDGSDADAAAASASGSGSASASSVAADDSATGVAGAVPEPRPSTAPDAVSLADAFAPYEAFGTDVAAGEFPRTIRHAMGETRIEQEPVRVVTLDTGELDGMIELGITPVGAVDYGATGLPAYFDRQAIDGVEVVGTIDQPNLEAIAALRPDLILSSSLRHEDIYGQLSQIAPTVFAERPGVTWKQNFQLYAQAVGREERADETVERYEARVEELSTQLPADRPEVSVVRIMADGQVRLYQRANFLGVLLTDLGFPRPEAQNVDDFATEVSLERLDQADGELIVFAAFDGTDNSYVDAVESSPIWQSLAGVQAGAVHTVDDQTWIGGIGYHAAFAVMDELAAITAG